MKISPAAGLHRNNQPPPNRQAIADEHLGTFYSSADRDLAD
jgi:hypothetical protein